MSLLDVVDEVGRFLEKRADAPRAGEGLTLRCHLLQCAWLARQEGAGDALIVASLLHDVAYCVDTDGSGGDAHGSDHAEAGARWLARFFGPEVAEPVRLHVAAKRYLSAKDPLYAASLGPASQRSLVAQGGPLRGWQVEAFAARPYAIDAIRLRRWDDRARTPGAAVPDVNEYLPMVRLLATTGVRADTASNRACSPA